MQISTLTILESNLTLVATVTISEVSSEEKDVSMRWCKK